MRTCRDVPRLPEVTITCTGQVRYSTGMIIQYEYNVIRVLRCSMGITQHEHNNKNPEGLTHTPRGFTHTIQEFNGTAPCHALPKARDMSLENTCLCPVGLPRYRTLTLTLPVIVLQPSIKRPLQEGERKKKAETS